MNDKFKSEAKPLIPKENYARLVKKYPGDNDAVPVKVWQPGIEHL